MASPWQHRCILSLVVVHLQWSTCLDRHPADSAAVAPDPGELHLMQFAASASTANHNGNERLQSDEAIWTEKRVVPAEEPISELQTLVTPDASRRKLLQAPGAELPFPPLKVLANGEPCILFQARKVSLRYERQRQLDLTEKVFSPHKPVDTSQSFCNQDKATLVMRVGDVEDMRGLSIRLQLSNTFYESSGQWWFAVESVSLLYNSTEEAAFNSSEVYAPSSSSYHCLHVSSLQRHSALLLPSTEQARHWAITFTNFQIQAFNVTSGTFSPASDCATFLTPAILMGLITSLILLLVLAYALHMVIHLKHIERDDEHKPDFYFPENAHQLEHCCGENAAEKNIL